jgi:electron transfer flavoprotein alpha subunit
MRVALVPVREGVLPTGALETVSEAGGTVVLMGSDVNAAIPDISPVSTVVVLAEAGDYAPAAWANAIAPHLAKLTAVVLPATADGRDLAPRVASELAWPLITGVVALRDEEVVVARHGGQVLETLLIDGPFVATVTPGVADPKHASREPVINNLLLEFSLSIALDADSLGVSEPDPSSLDLSEAKRILAGGAGLGSQESFYELIEVADSMQASVGGTRVVMDWGWIPFDRQIGTTGVMVNPELYIALGISGAVQHTAGLGEPKHVIAVNSDPHCPMMSMADLAIVTDAPEFVKAMMSKLTSRTFGR